MTDNNSENKNSFWHYGTTVFKSSVEGVIGATTSFTFEDEGHRSRYFAVKVMAENGHISLKVSAWGGGKIVLVDRSRTVMCFDEVDLPGPSSFSNVGTEYVEANGQLYHHGLAEDYGFNPDHYTKWIEIPLELAAAHVRDQFWTHRKDQEVDLLDSSIYQDVPPMPDSTIIWVADHDISDNNIFETVIIVEDEEIEAIVIDAIIPFPFPEVLTVDVAIHNGLDRVDLFIDTTIKNLDHYALNMHRLEEALQSAQEYGEETDDLAEIYSDAMIERFS